MDSRPVLGSKLSPGAKLALFALRRFARQKATCWPGQERLAADVGCSSRSIRTYLAELRAAGAVTVRRRGLGRTNVYALLPIWNGNERRCGAAESAAETLRGSKRKEKQPNPSVAPIAAATSPAAEGGRDVVSKMLRAEGVSPKVADKLALTATEAEVREQVAALPYRKPRDRAAVLVTAVRERWEPPKAYVDARRKADAERAQALDRDRRDVDAMRDAETRAQARQRLDSMPLAERQALEARARADVRDRTNNLLAANSESFARMVAARVVTYAAESTA